MWSDLAIPGREYQPQVHPERVRVYDFLDPALGKICPYGVYDMTTNTGWVSVGMDHDTAQFAVVSIRSWWAHMGQALYPEARKLGSGN
jgi:Rhodopirellula transposase DDE domain